MRRNGKTNFKEQQNKQIARRMYALRKIDTFIKWTITQRGYLKWKHLKEQYERYNLPWQD